MSDLVGYLSDLVGYLIFQLGIQACYHTPDWQGLIREIHLEAKMNDESNSGFSFFPKHLHAR